MRTQDKTLKEKIIKDLLQTGFPLEVSISNTLRTLEWTVTNSPLYVDPEDKTTRELDIYALKIYSETPSASVFKNDPFLFSHLIIQCKKSAKPWVFFDNAGEEPYWVGFYSIKCDNTDIIPRLCSDTDVVRLTDHRYKKIKRHRSFHIFDNAGKKQSGNKDIYESLITSCKALEYYKNMYAAGSVIHVLTPVIILDGTSLWSASLDKKSKISLKKVPSLIVKFDYIFGDKKPSSLNYQFVEIITQEYFKKNLKLIEADNSRILKSWSNYYKAA